jgi:hypothetical protein
MTIQPNLIALWAGLTADPMQAVGHIAGSRRMGSKGRQAEAAQDRKRAKHFNLAE